MVPLLSLIWIECFNPELLGTKYMQSYEDTSKHIPQIPRLEWEHYIVMPPPQPLPKPLASLQSRTINNISHA